MDCIISYLPCYCILAACLCACICMDVQHNFLPHLFPINLTRIIVYTLCPRHVVFFKFASQHGSSHFQDVNDVTALVYITVFVSAKKNVGKEKHSNKIGDHPRGPCMVTYLVPQLSYNTFSKHIMAARLGIQYSVSISSSCLIFFPSRTQHWMNVWMM